MYCQISFSVQLEIGKTLLDHLETVDVTETESEAGFYMPVQRVCRPNHEFRGFQGQIESGKIKVGQTITTLPSNETATVKSLLNGSTSVEEAVTGQAVTIQLDKEVDVSRGCVLTDQARLSVAKSFTATLLWMDDSKLTLGKEYLVKLGTKRIPGFIRSIKYGFSPSFSTVSSTPQADVIWLTRSIKIISPSVLCFLNSSRTIFSASSISHRAISFFSI